jgi:hypothetical protein
MKSLRRAGRETAGQEEASSHGVTHKSHETEASNREDAERSPLQRLQAVNDFHKKYKLQCDIPQHMLSLRLCD